MVDLPQDRRLPRFDGEMPESRCIGHRIEPRGAGYYGSMSVIEASRFAARSSRWSSATGAEQQLEQRLLGVQPVLGLIPDRRPLPVKRPFGDLLARVRG